MDGNGRHVRYVKKADANAVWLLLQGQVVLPLHPPVDGDRHNPANPDQNPDPHLAVLRVHREVQVGRRNRASQTLCVSFILYCI